MIHELTKEQPQQLNVEDGLIAFIGNINDCSLYAGRAAKTHLNLTWTLGLSKHIDLTKPAEPIGFMYYLGEYFNNSLPSLIREGTKLIVVVDDHLDRLNATLVLLSKIAPDIQVQILQAKSARGVTTEQLKLDASDKLVIRELERMFLKGTELNTTRELLRVQVDAVELYDDEAPIEYEHVVLSIEDLALMSSDAPINTARLVE